MTITYRDAGVDIDAGDRLVDRIKVLAAKTKTRHVLGGIGGFAGLCRVPPGMTEPVLVSGTDGVGTKLKVAFAAQRHDTIGIDLVAMCVNDIVTCGATPLFFLDYFASGKLDVDTGAAVIRGIADGCSDAGCALLGGETAEMPGMYADGEYDLAGFAVGVVERARIVDGSTVRAGDVVLALASSGLHSNGYSLVRRVLLEHAKLPLDAKPSELAGEALGEVLLRPTRIYVRAALRLTELGLAKAMCHVTGGGLPGNLPRVLPDGLGAVVDPARWREPGVFALIATLGDVPLDDMRRTFNLGVGLVVVVAPADVARATRELEALGETVSSIGTIENVDRGIEERVRYLRS